MPGPAETLRELESEGLLRHLRPLGSGSGIQVSRDGKELWNFASNDYLGLSHHPRVTEAFIEGVRRFGAGSTASRPKSKARPRPRKA